MGMKILLRFDEDATFRKKSGIFQNLGRGGVEFETTSRQGLQHLLPIPRTRARDGMYWRIIKVQSPESDKYFLGE